MMRIRELSYSNAKSYMGRFTTNCYRSIRKELESIIGNGFSVIYLISQRLVKNH